MFDTGHDEGIYFASAADIWNDVANPSDVCMRVLIWYNLHIVLIGKQTELNEM